MRRILKGFLVIAIIISTFVTGINYTKAVSDGEIIYPVNADAYIRSGNNANNNYNYENITQAHGQQYVGKNYKVIDTKYYPDGSKIISVMKLELPSIEELVKFYLTLQFLKVLNMKVKMMMKKEFELI